MNHVLQVLRTFVNNCLRMAQQKGLTSIAFPAIGTGNLGIPRPSVAKWMFDEVISFSNSNPASCVTAVNFVLYSKDTQTVKVRGGGVISCRGEGITGEGGARGPLLCTKPSLYLLCLHKFCC